MRSSQEMELTLVQNAQRLQFADFEKAWDSYMQDYEMAAQQSLSRMFHKHELEA